jgi:hypothetical protein
MPKLTDQVGETGGALPVREGVQEPSVLGTITDVVGGASKSIFKGISDARKDKSDKELASVTQSFMRKYDQATSLKDVSQRQVRVDSILAQIAIHPRGIEIAKTMGSAFGVKPFADANDAHKARQDQMQEMATEAYETAVDQNMPYKSNPDGTPDYQGTFELYVNNKDFTRLVHAKPEERNRINAEEYRLAASQSRLVSGDELLHNVLKLGVNPADAFTRMDLQLKDTRKLLEKSMNESDKHIPNKQTILDTFDSNSEKLKADLEDIVLKSDARKVKSIVDKAELNFVEQSPYVAVMARLGIPESIMEKLASIPSREDVEKGLRGNERNFEITGNILNGWRKGAPKEGVTPHSAGLAEAAAERGMQGLDTEGKRGHLELVSHSQEHIASNPNAAQTEEYLKRHANVQAIEEMKKLAFEDPLSTDKVNSYLTGVEHILFEQENLLSDHLSDYNEGRSGLGRLFEGDRAFNIQRGEDGRFFLNQTREVEGVWGGDSPLPFYVRRDMEEGKDIVRRLNQTQQIRSLLEEGEAKTSDQIFTELGLDDPIEVGVLPEPQPGLPPTQSTRQPNPDPNFIAHEAVNAALAKGDFPLAKELIDEIERGEFGNKVNKELTLEQTLDVAKEEPQVLKKMTALDKEFLKEFGDSDKPEFQRFNFSNLTTQGQKFFGVTDGKRFGSFATPLLGLRAGIINQRTKVKRNPNITVKEFHDIFTPDNKENQLVQSNGKTIYENSLVNLLKILKTTEKTKVTSIDEGKFAKAIIQKETSGKIPMKYIKAAQKLADLPLPDETPPEDR